MARGGAILDPAQAGSLKPGDYGYFLAAPERVAELDGLFASTEAGRARPSLGEFPLRGEAALAQLVELYGLEVEPEEVGLTVAEIFDRPLRERAEGRRHARLRPGDPDRPRRRRGQGDAGGPAARG